MNVSSPAPEAVKAIVVRAVTELQALVQAAAAANDPDAGTDDAFELVLNPSMGSDAFLKALAGLTYALQCTSYDARDPAGYGGGMGSLALGGEFLADAVDGLPEADIQALDDLGTLLADDPANALRLYLAGVDAEIAARKG